MKTIITGTHSAMTYQAPDPGAFYANSNYTPSCSSGAITADNAVEFLRRIAAGG